MKKSFKIIAGLSVVAAIFLLTGFCFGKKEKPLVKIDVLKMNVFYYGTDNPISISASGIDPKDLFVSIKGGILQKDSIVTSRYHVFPTKEFAYIYIDVSTKSGSDTKLLQTDTFRVKSIQNPLTYFGIIHNDGYMSEEEIHGQLGLFSRMSDCDFDGTFMIESFKMSVYSEGQWKETMCKGPAFTKEMIHDLSKLQSNDKIIFSEVMVKGVGGFLGASPRKINDLFITVK